MNSTVFYTIPIKLRLYVKKFKKKNKMELDTNTSIGLPPPVLSAFKVQLYADVSVSMCAQTIVLEKLSMETRYFICAVEMAVLHY